LKEGVTEI